MTATDVRERDEQQLTDANRRRTDGEPRPRPASGGAGAGAGLALLASVGVCVWLLAGRRGEADELQQQREQVMAQTRQFLLRMGTYGPDLLDDQGGMPEYRVLVREVITPKFKASFEKQAGDRRAAGRPGRRGRGSRRCSPRACRTSTRTPRPPWSPEPSPTPTSSRASRRGRRAVPFRIEVSLVKIDGTWLVDDFTPLTGAEEPSRCSRSTTGRAPSLYDLSTSRPTPRRGDPGRLAGRDRRARARRS